jgi:hypothetical protein
LNEIKTKDSKDDGDGKETSRPGKGSDGEEMKMRIGVELPRYPP